MDDIILSGWWVIDLLHPCWNFRDGYGVEDKPLPVVLTHDARGTAVLISADDINALGTLPDLMDLVSKAMEGLAR